MPNKQQPDEKNPYPYKAQGDILKLARGKRTQQEVAASLGFAKTHVGKYQNWEYGRNAPSRKYWPAIKTVLGQDAARLYAGVQGHDEGTEPQLDPRVILAMINSIESTLTSLKMLCAPHVSNAVLRGEGIEPIDTQTGKKIKEKSRA